MKKVLGALLALSMLGAPEIAVANQVTALEVTRKVNVAGRQRMLSQRMAKSACMFAADVNPTGHFDQLNGAFNLFTVSNEALRYGNPEMDLGPEHRKAVMGALQKIDIPWNAYRKIIEGIIEDQTVSAARVETISDASVDVLFLMNRAVNQTARSYGNVLPDVPLTLTITIDVAGRQRMLTQKSMKELCLLYVSENPAKYAPLLEKTTRIFDLSLTALQFGYADAGVMPAPTPELEEQLALVRQLWTPIYDTLQSAIATGSISNEQLTELAAATEPLLFEMNRAVGMYEIDNGET